MSNLNGNGNGTAPAIDTPSRVSDLMLDLKNERRADYSAEQPSRHKRPRPGVANTGASADYDVRNDFRYYQAAAIAWDMQRNDTVVGTIARRSVQNVLQDGFTFDPQTPDAGLNVELSLMMNGWAKDPSICDASGRFTVHQMASMMLLADKIGGDSFVLPRDNGTLQAIEGYRCRSPQRDDKIMLGIERDGDRRPIAYHFTPDDMDARYSYSQQSEEPQRYAARDSDGMEQVWHLFSPDRYSQTRGVSALYPVFTQLGLFDDTQLAYLVKLQSSACVAFISGSDSEFNPTPAPLGTATTETQPDGKPRTREDMTPGSVIETRKGETLTGFSPGIATGDEQEFLRNSLQLIASALDVPLISVLMDGRETNFSGWRGAIDQAKIGWRIDQTRYADGLYAKAYRFRLLWLLSQSAALRSAFDRLGESMFAVRVNKSRWPYIEPVKDITAAGLEKANLLVSPRRQGAERNYDWDQTINETVADNAQAISLVLTEAEKLREKFGVAVDPSRLLYLDPKQPLLLPVDPIQTQATEPTDTKPVESQVEKPAEPQSAEPDEPAASFVPEPIRVEPETVAAEATPEPAASRSVQPHYEQYRGVWSMLPSVAQHFRQLADGTDMTAYLAAQQACGMCDTDTGGEYSYKTTGMGDRVAIVELTGPMTKRGSSMLGGISTAMMRRTLRKADADPQVEHIVLLVDSPGGSVTGTGDLADDVHRINQSTPITVYVEDTAASAAYWVSAQASRIVASPNAWIGSIGVFQVMADLSEQAGKLGVKVHVIKAGEFKGLGVGGAEITDDQLVEVQREVDDTYSAFTAAIARGRGVDTERATAWGDGRIYLASDAMTLGLIDEIASFDEAIGRIELELDQPGLPGATPLALENAHA